MMKKFTLTFIAAGLCVALFAAFIRRDDVPLDKLVASLQRWTDSIPQEKIYLHMDKPYYAIGDTMWFKGYLTIGSHHQLSALSGAMYVELLSERDSVLQQLKLPVTSGMVMGDIILKDDYPQGTYRIRAYTQWMRNACNEYFYDHSFLVGDVAAGDIVAKADFSYRNNKGKQALTAVLSYAHEDGKAYGEQDVRYEIWANHKPLWQQNTKTDALGTVKVIIPDDIKLQPQGAYIHTILKGQAVRDFAIKASFSQSDVQFFPESGNLVNGISSRVAFKVVNVDGLGASVKGTITDNDKKEVAKLETLHAGMGNFNLNPQSGKTYTANIIFEDGSTKSVALPMAVDKGYVLSVYQPGTDSVLVRISTPAALLQQPVNLIAQTSGEVIFSSPVKIDKPVTSIWLDKKSFPSGIAQFTLFDGAGEPLNERIAFIRSNDQMTLDIKSAKADYRSKERVQIDLNATDSKGKPTFGNFSVSVIDETRTPFDENKESTIQSNLLLSSDIKGYVEQPNYYFAQKGEQVDKALDNLMLTQGYRRFTWKKLGEIANAKPQFKAEGLGVILSGRVTNLAGTPSPVANATVSLIALRAKLVKAATTDADGRFAFDPIFMTDSIKFTLQARTAKGGDKVKLEMDSIPQLKVTPNPNLADVSLSVHTSLKKYLDNGKREDDAFEKLGMLDHVHRLKEVKIRAQKPDPLKNYAQQWAPMIPDGHADQTYYPKNLDEAAYLGTALQGYLHKVVFLSHTVHGLTFPLYPHLFMSGKPVPMSVVLNGRKLGEDEAMGIFDGSQLEPSDVVRIDLFMLAPTMYIYTKPENQRRQRYTPSIVNLLPKGFNKAREFYAPRYDRPGDATKLPDLRTTVYWNPALKTDADGNCSFNFYNADGPGTYKVIIEGINADGELGRQVYHYRVGSGLAENTAFVAPPKAEKSLVSLTAPIDSFNKRLPLEKVYLHTDKPYYSIGDTLWFKSYVLDGVNLTASRQSGLLYVELVDDSAHVVRRVSVPVKDGIGRGQIPLKAIMFKEGGYTLRAYTNWMQNFNGAYLFTQRFYMGVPSLRSWLVNSASKIQKVNGKDQLQANLKLSHAKDPTHPVAYQKVEVKLYDEWHYLTKQEMQTGADGSLNISQDLGAKSDGRRIRVQITSLNKDDNFMVTQVPLLINRPQNIDVQFMPEGGNLVAGIKSVVGFKAIAEDGRGIAVVGDVFDSKNNKVASFMPLHQGMGTFEFTPSGDETYTARITQPTTKSFPLPKVQAKGVVMHVINPEQGNDIKIELSGLGLLAVDSACYLIGTSRGIAYYTQKIDLNKPYLSVPKSTFPSGVARFTFFKGHAPLTERAIFIDNQDQLNISLTPNKSAYTKRDSVGLDIVIKDKNGAPVQGNFSLAVTDDSQVKPDSLGDNNIATSLLLNSELKGTVESPGYYINRKDKQAWQALDNLMLTQGWTGYDWKELFAPAKPVKFKTEQPFAINGRVSNVVNKPLPYTKVRLTSLRPPLMTDATSDENGLFNFTGLPHVDSAAYLLQALNDKGEAKGTGAVTVDRFKAETEPKVSSILTMPWYINTDTVQLNLVKRKAAIGKDEFELSGRVLSEVKINSKKIIAQSHSSFGPGGSDMVFNRKDIKESGTVNLYELLAQKLPGFKVWGSWVISFDGQMETLPILVFNHYSIDLRIDGWPLPLDIDEVDDRPVGFSKDTLLNIKTVLAVPLDGPRRAKLKLFPNSNEVIEALSDIKIEGLMGLEVVYSNKNTNRAGPQDFTWAHVEITTSSGRGWYRDTPPASVTYRPLPLVQSKLFYSPKYNIVSPIKVPDYRSTVFWEPDVVTDRNGRAKVSFFTTDIQSKYTVKVAGVDANGNLGDTSIKLNPKNTGTTASSIKN